MMTRRVVRALLACAALGALLAAPAAEVRAAPPDAELAYLASLNAFGLTVYDTGAALRTGYAVCAELGHETGLDVARQLFASTSWAELPTMDSAGAVVVAAAMNLCTWHYHPERVAAGGLTAASKDLTR